MTYFQVNNESGSVQSRGNTKESFSHGSPHAQGPYDTLDMNKIITTADVHRDREGEFVAVGTSTILPTQFEHVEPTFSPPTPRNQDNREDISHERILRPSVSFVDSITSES